MKNNLVILLCHCDTDEKLQVLKENIKLLKTEGFHIAIVSHIPLSSDIQKDIEYFIFDKNNPILHYPQRGFKYWHTRPYLENKSVQLITYESDYGWTVFNQIIKAGKFALQLDYNYYSFLNYDINLTPTLLKELNLPHSFLCSKIQDSNNNLRFPSLVFNILSKENLIKLLPLIKLEDYISKEGNNIIYPEAEAYWKHLISFFEIQILEEITTDRIDFGEKDLFNQNKDNELFKFFFSKDQLKLYLYGLNTDLPLTFKINEDLQEVNSFPTILSFDNIDNIGYYHQDKFYDLTDLANSTKYHFINVLNE